MMGDDRRVDDRGRNYTLGMRKFLTMRVPRCTIIAQDRHNDFSSDHWVVTCGGGG